MYVCVCVCVKGQCGVYKAQSGLDWTTEGSKKAQRGPKRHLRPRAICLGCARAHANNGALLASVRQRGNGKAALASSKVMRAHLCLDAVSLCKQRPASRVCMYVCIKPRSEHSGTDVIKNMSSFLK